MSDDTDLATEREEMDRANALRAARRAAERDKLPDVGQCHYCAEVVPQGARFCDTDCRDGWQREQSARQRAGRSVD